MRYHVALNIRFLCITYDIFDGKSRLGSECERTTELFFTRFERVVDNSLIATFTWSVDVNLEWTKMIHSKVEYFGVIFEE